MGEVLVRRATVADVVAIQRLVGQYAERGQMLHRALHQLYECIRDFHVAFDGDTLLGCCALHVDWANLAEGKSLAVGEDCQRRGVGRRLVETCLADARALGIALVYCLTESPEFFRRLGFQDADRAALPRKVWGECVRCPRFNDCTEVAMTLQVLAIPTPAPEDPLQSLAALPRRHVR